MRWKLIVLGLTVFLLTGMGAAVQPKIVKVSDNLGNQWRIDVSDDADGASVESNEEIVVADDTVITLCVEEIRKNEGDSIKFSYEAWIEGVRDDDIPPSNPTDDNCNTWDLSQEQYQKDWTFMIYVRNQDDVHYFGTEKADFRLQVDYTNLKLPDDGESVTETYKTVKVDQSVYERLQKEANKPSPSENQVIVNESVWEHKNERIRELEQQVQDLQETVEQLRNQVQKLNQSRGVTDELTGQEQKQQERDTRPQQPDGRQENRDSGNEQGGFLGVISSIFG